MFRRPFEIAGRVAVVTGAGSGIGRALARLLARRGAATVVVADIDGRAAESVAAEIGDGARAQALDVADEPAVAALVDRVEAECGPIHLFCSNAGVNRGRGLGSTADWQASLSVNLLGHVHAARHAVPRMAARREGYFLVTASAAGLLSDPRSAPYSASKHAAVALAEWLAVQHGEAVFFACLCPEGVRTGMTGPDSGAVAGSFLEADAVAEAALRGLAEGRFLILTHPRTGEFEQRRAADRDRWLGGLRRAVSRPPRPVHLQTGMSER